MTKKLSLSLVPEVKYINGKPTLKSIKDNYMAKLQIGAISRQKMVSREVPMVLNDFVKQLEKNNIGCACKCGKKKK